MEITRPSDPMLRCCGRRIITEMRTPKPRLLSSVLGLRTKSTAAACCGWRRRTLWHSNEMTPRL